MKKISKFINKNLHWLIVLFVALLCATFLKVGHISESGNYITLDGSDAQITESTKEFIEDANEALNRIMNEDKPTDEKVEEAYDEPVGKGFYTTIEEVIARRKPDGFNNNGLGLQCSKYTGYLGTGKMEYSREHPDYGPVNGKAIAEWLVKNYGFKYIDKPVKGAIGSGGFNTLYGHTAMFLYSTGDNTAMVNDANYTPLKVSTHNMNISGWVWAVPSSYNPEPEPTPTPDPEPTPETSTCEKWILKWGDTLGKIMKTCEGKVTWGEAMNDYARSWVDSETGITVYDGWNSYKGIGLYAGHTIIYQK